MTAHDERAAAVLAALVASLPIEAQHRPAVHAALAVGLGRAAERWPGVHVEPTRFASFLVERMGDAPDPAARVQAACLRDLVCACACVDGDDDAITLLERDVIGKLDAPLLRLLPSTADRDEVVQLVRERLLVGDAHHGPQLTRYSGRGSLRAFCTIVATRVALNMLRGRHREVLVDDDEGLAAPVLQPDPEITAIYNDRRADLGKLVRAAIQLVSARDRLILRQSYLDGLSIDELGALHRVHRATAARWIVAATAAVRANVRRLLIERSHVSEADIDSLMRILGSRLDVTLSGALREAETSVD